MVTQVGNLIPDAGETDVPNAGTRVALSSDGGLSAEFRIVWARFKAKTTNTGTVYVGVADVSATQGWELTNDGTVNSEVELPIPLGGSIPVGDIYFDAATNGDDVQWFILYQAV